MSKKYWTHIKTNKYDIYLTSKTVYIFNKDGREIKKFKDLDYGYMGCVSPNEDLLVVKSSSGRIAVYSLDKLELIKNLDSLRLMDHKMITLFFLQMVNIYLI